MQMHYQAHLPVMGCMFSPRYGQSYYEIYQGYGDRNVRFTSPANALSLRQLFSLDFCFARTTLRVSSRRGSRGHKGARHQPFAHAGLCAPLPNLKA